MTENDLKQYQKFVMGEVEKKEILTLLNPIWIDVTWKQLNSLRKVIKNKVLSGLMGFLHSKWCGQDQDREDGPRIGSFKIFFDFDGALHFDFSTRFILNSEEQIIIREMVQEIKEEDMWIQKFFERLKCKNDNPNDDNDPRFAKKENVEIGSL